MKSIVLPDNAVTRFTENKVKIIYLFFSIDKFPGGGTIRLKEYKEVIAMHALNNQRINNLQAILIYKGGVL